MTLSLAHAWLEQSEKKGETFERQGTPIQQVPWFVPEEVFMSKPSFMNWALAAALALGLAKLVVFPGPSLAATAVPAPATDVPMASAPGQQTAVFAGGCFWGVQAVFQHVKGVLSAVS